MLKEKEIYMELFPTHQDAIRLGLRSDTSETKTTLLSRVRLQQL